MNKSKISWWQRFGQLFDRFIARWPTMEKPTINWELLHRYTEGKATEAERQAVNQWLDKADSEDIRTFFDPRSNPEETKALMAEFWDRVERGEMAAFPAYQDYAPREPIRDLRVVLWARANRLKAAAVVALILGGALAAWQAGRVMGERYTAGAFGSINVPVGLPPLSASLPDGSRVVVSPGSILRYATTFGVGRREVQLEGEAYFAVRHNAGRPFVVRAGDLVAEDLGTEFVVRAYPEDAYARIVVREGRVGIAGTTVNPGQLGRLGDDGTPIVESADIASWFAWTRGELSIAGFTLRDVLPKLGRWYNLEFRLADPALGDRALQGTLSPDIDVTLRELEFILGCQVTREGNVVTFHARSQAL